MSLKELEEYLKELRDEEYECEMDGDVSRGLLAEIERVKKEIEKLR